MIKSILPLLLKVRPPTVPATPAAGQKSRPKGPPQATEADKLSGQTVEGQLCPTARVTF